MKSNLNERFIGCPVIMTNFLCVEFKSFCACCWYLFLIDAENVFVTLSFISSHFYNTNHIQNTIIFFPKFGVLQRILQLSVSLLRFKTMVRQGDGKGGRSTRRDSALLLDRIDFLSVFMFCRLWVIQLHLYMLGTLHWDWIGALHHGSSGTHHKGWHLWLFNKVDQSIALELVRFFLQFVAISFISASKRAIPVSVKSIFLLGRPLVSFFACSMVAMCACKARLFTVLD